MYTHFGELYDFETPVVRLVSVSFSTVVIGIPPLVLVHGRAFSMNVALFNAALDVFSMDPSAEIEFPS